MTDSKPKYTTVQVDLDTREKLGLIAEAHRRSMSAHVQVMVEREYEELKRLKLLPRKDGERRTHDDPRKDDRRHVMIEDEAA